jgi:uncharacterized membrane protein YhiD involved in acid resistance
MSENNKIAALIIIVIPVLFGATTLFVVQSDKVKKPDDALSIIMSAPSKALENAVAGIMGFLGGGGLVMVNEKKKREELEKQNEDLEAELTQLRELNGL